MSHSREEHVVCRCRARASAPRLGLRQFRDTRENVDEAEISPTISRYLGPESRIRSNILSGIPSWMDTIFYEEPPVSLDLVISRVSARASRLSAIFTQIDVNDEVVFERTIRKIRAAREWRRECLARTAPENRQFAWRRGRHVPLFLFLSRWSSSSPAWSHTSTWPFRPLFSLLIVRSTRGHGDEERERSTRCF